MINISEYLGPIGKIFTAAYDYFKRKPKFEVTLDTKNLKRSSVLTIGIWVKNLSSRPHNIVKIEGEHEGHHNNFKISIVDRKYNLPIPLDPNKPETIIVFLGQFLHGDPDPNSDCNITIKIFSRWQGKEVEAGRLKIPLK